MSCPQCAEGQFLPGEPVGSFQSDFQGAYLASAPSGGSSKRAVLLLTDGFGLPLKNCKIIADNLAKRLECDVWIPDYFGGKPLIPIDALVTPDRADQKMTLWDWIRFIVTVGLANLPAFISSRPSVVDKRLATFFALLKEKKGYEKLGAVGYCYGGATCIRLGSTDFVQSVVICHPGSFDIGQVRAIKIPASWVCAEVDVFFPNSLRLQSEAEFVGRKDTERFVEYEFKEYAGTAHGFASRPNLSYPEIKEAYEQSFEQTVNWFQKTLAIDSTSPSSQPQEPISSTVE